MDEPTEYQLHQARRGLTARRGGTVESAVRAELADPAARDEELLQALRALEWLRAETDRLEADVVDALRSPDLRPNAAVSWARIGAAVGVSRQGMERRYLRAAARRLTTTQHPDTGRAALQRARATDADNARRSLARWGRSGPAEQPWRIDVSVTDPATGRATDAILSGPAGIPPRFGLLQRTGGGFFYRAEVARGLVSAADQAAPWPDVEPVQGLDGLTDPAPDDTDDTDDSNPELPTAPDAESPS